MKKFLPFSFLVLLAGSCLTTSNRGNDIQRRQVSMDLADIASETLELANTQKIDATKLKLENISVKAVDIDGSLSPWVTFDMDVQAESVEYQVCDTLKNPPDCTLRSQVIENFLITGVQPGLQQIKLRACVRPARALVETENCGRWYSELYQQKEDTNVTLRRMVDELDALNQKLKNLGLTIYDAMIVYKANVGKCTDEKITKLIPKEVYDKYIALGPVLIGVGLSDPNAVLVMGEDGFETIVYPDSIDDDGDDEGTSKEDLSKEAVGVTVIVGALVVAKLAGKAAVGYAAGYVKDSALKYWDDVASPKLKERFGPHLEKITPSKGKQKFIKYGGIALVTIGLISAVSYLAVNDPETLSAVVSGIGDAFVLTESNNTDPCIMCKNAVAQVLSASKDAESLRNVITTKKLLLNEFLAKKNVP